jgi:hypothetical protein
VAGGQGSLAWLAKLADSKISHDGWTGRLTKSYFSRFTMVWLDMAFWFGREGFYVAICIN